jgi:hypothetical protein
MDTLTLFYEGECQYFSNQNSPIPEGYIYPMEVRDNGEVWIGVNDYMAEQTSSVIVKLGDNYTTYSSSNSPLNTFEITDIAFEDNNVWISTANDIDYFPPGAIYLFDGTNWTFFDTANSPLPSTQITDICISPYGTKWFGTADKGMIKYTGFNWEIFNTENSGIPGNNVTTITVDDNNRLWLGIKDIGLAMNDGNDWSVFTPYNSGLISERVDKILIDGNNTKWITPIGLCGYNENAIPVGINDDKPSFNNFDIKEAIRLSPNPAKDILYINFPEYLIKEKYDCNYKIFSISGQKLIQMNCYGLKDTEIDVSDLPAGLYLLQISDQANVLLKEKFIILR